MKHLAKTLFICVLLALGVNQANATLTHFVANPSQSQFTGGMSLDGTITASYLFISDSSSISSTGSFTGPVTGTIDANVDTSGGVFGFQDITLSSPINASLSDSTVLFVIPLSVEVSVTNATVDLVLPSSLSSLTYSGSDNVYSWGPTAMDLDFTGDYTTTISIYGSPNSFSDTVPFSVSLTDASGTVELDALGNPIAYSFGIPGDLAYPFSFTTSSGLYTIDFDGNLTLSSLSLDLSGTSTVVPVPAAIYLFGSGLLGLIFVGRRKLL